MDTLERISLLEDRVSQLRDVAMKQHDSNVQVESIAILETATAMAFRSVVADLAMHAGLQPSHVDEVIRRKTNYYHEKLIEGLDPDSELSARLDGRTLDELSDDDEVPRLFPVSE